MKKLIFVLPLLLSTAPILSNSMDANAAEVKMNQASLGLPNLVDKKVASDIISHSYNYKNLSLNDSRKSLYKKWGKPNEAAYVKGFNKVDGQFLYGKKNNVTIQSQTNNLTNYDSLKINSIKVKTNGSKYEYKNVYPIYKKSFQAVKKSNKIYLSNDTTVITFEKNNGKYYATEFLYESYSRVLE